MKKTLFTLTLASATMAAMTASAGNTFRCASPTGWCTYVTTTSASELNTANIQQRLINLGYTIPNGADGIMDKATRTAVKAFQRDNGLAVDGVVGTHTATALNNRSYHSAPTGYAYNNAPTIGYGYYGPVVISGFAYAR